MLIDYNMSKDYCSDWTAIDAIREMVQNAIDSGCDYECKAEQGYITVTTKGKQLPLDTLMLGQSVKSDDAIGKYGEGYKIGMLVLSREGLLPSITTSGHSITGGFSRNQLSVDLETLGTLVDSQILSIGLAMFDLKTGNIGPTLYLPITLDNDEPVNATVGTIKFWVGQAQQNPEALKGLLDSYEPNHEAVPMHKALQQITHFVQANKPDNVWANGTKFDLGMLEHQFHKNNQLVPWWHNADRCMRTLRQFAGQIEVDTSDYQLVDHNALADAVWQAKYISAACNKLGLV